MDETELVFLDLETTGFSPNSGSEIIEISLLKCLGNEVRNSYTSFVASSSKVPQEITNLTGIQTDDLGEAPSLPEVEEKFFGFCDGCYLVAHNSSFDLRFLNELFFVGDQKLTGFCTMRLARRVFPHFESYSLPNLARELALVTRRFHRAEDDSLATLQLWLKIMATLREVCDPTPEVLMKIQASPPKLYRTLGLAEGVAKTLESKKSIDLRLVDKAVWNDRSNPRNFANELNNIRFEGLRAINFPRIDWKSALNRPHEGFEGDYDRYLEHFPSSIKVGSDKPNLREQANVPTARSPTKDKPSKVERHVWIKAIIILVGLFAVITIAT